MTADVSNIIKEIRKKTDFVPKVALTLGSGLGNYASEVDTVCTIDYHDLPGFPVSTAPGHSGRFILGYVGGVPVICMQGRVHLYEGYTPREVVMPVRVMCGLGAGILFTTNASGGIKSSYKPGTLALITDHISCFVKNPLIGPNDEEEGVRFPDMSQAYDRELSDIIRASARDAGIELQEGVYCQLTGPSFESPAEIRMLKALGADMVGMSTVIEVVAARHAGMRVCGISLISNLAAGISPVPLSSEDVNAAGEAAEPKFTQLVSRSIKAMADI